VKESILKIVLEWLCLLGGLRIGLQFLGRFIPGDISLGCRVRPFPVVHQEVESMLPLLERLWSLLNLVAIQSWSYLRCSFSARIRVRQLLSLLSGFTLSCFMVLVLKNV
jgi:hypothetical protein